MSSYEVIQNSYAIGGGELPIESESVDLIFADPPYNIGVKYEDDPSKDSVDPLTYWETLGSTILQLQKCARKGATLWWVCPEAHGDAISPILEECFGPKLYRIIWHETFSQYNRYDLTQDYRFIFCHVKSDKTTDKRITKNLDGIRIPSARMAQGDRRAAGPKIPGRVWQLRRLQGTSKARVKWHPAQMPPEVLQRIVKGWSSPSDLILDAFAGSGSLGIECLNLERNFIGVDQSQTYCDLMHTRLELEKRKLI